MTATGTEVGKTFVTAGLLRAGRRAGLPMAALKPVMSGYDPADPASSDAGVLLAALGRPATAAAVADLAPYRFAAPLSPDMAAEAEGRSLDVDAVIAACRSAAGARNVVLIEGVGGVMVPLEASRTVLDVIAPLALPVLLVTGSGLGALSHCLTAIAALAGRGVAPCLVVVNETAGSTVPLDATERTLRRFCQQADLAVLPRDPPETAFDALLATLRPLCGFAKFRHTEPRAGVAQW